MARLPFSTFFVHVAVCLVVIDDEVASTQMLAQLLGKSFAPSLVHGIVARLGSTRT